MYTRDREEEKEKKNKTYTSMDQIMYMFMLEIICNSDLLKSNILPHRHSPVFF